MTKKKEIIPLFHDRDQLYWQYKIYSHDDQIKVQQFLDQNSKEFEKQMKDDTYQNLAFLCEKIGVMLHPEFKKEYENEIDFVSIKLLNYCWKFGKLECLKFANNDFKQDELPSLKSLIMDNKIKMLFFDFNPIQNNEFLTALSQHHHLKVLSLRGNDLNDEQIQIFCQGISNYEQSQLSCLELYSNNFTEQGLESIANMLEFNKSIEYLGLARNSIENMNCILEKITRSYFNEQDLIEYKKSLAERDAIVLKNSKQKNAKLIEPVPQLQPLYMENECKISYFRRIFGQKQQINKYQLFYQQNLES